MSSKVKSQEVLLYNLGDLVFTWLTVGKNLALKTKSGKTITNLAVDEGCSKEEMVFSILDKALGLTIKDDKGNDASYAFLNPHTKQIALRSIPKTITFDGASLGQINPLGTWFTFSDDMLINGAIVLKTIEPDYSLIKTIIANNL